MADNLTYFIHRCLLKTQIWVALMFAFLVAFFSDNQLLITDFLFAFCLSLTAYNFIIYYTFWVKKKLLFPYFLIFSFAFIFLIYQILQHKIYNLYLLSICFGLVICYRFIRKFNLLKNIFIAISWSFAILAITHFTFSKFCVLALFIFGLAIPFDWKTDTIIENEENIRCKSINSGEAKKASTLHSQNTLSKYRINLGLAKTISLLSIFASLLFSWCLISDFKLNLIWSFSLCIAMLMILFANHSRNNFYYSFWIESVSALPFILMIIFR